MIEIMMDYSILTGLVVGTVALFSRVYIFPLIQRKIFAIGGLLFGKRLVEALNLGLSFSFYSLDSDGFEMSPNKKKNRVIIQDPLRIEDDEFLTSKNTPYIFFDPNTMKIKGYFHVINHESIVDKHSRAVYEGKLELIEKIEIKGDSNE